MRWAMFAAALTLFHVQPAGAAESKFTGRDLYEWCTAKPGTIPDTLCSLYVAGYTHGARAAGGALDAPFCLPDYLAPLEVRAAYIRMVRTARQTKTPNLLDAESMDIALGGALTIAYPCPEPRHSPE
jgi:hypothetical protein